jgi:hypothetical protein
VLGTCPAPGPGGGVDPGTAYFVNMAPGFVQPNFPYDISLYKLDGVFAEFIDYGDCDTEPAFAEIGQRFKSQMDDYCDFDGYRFSLEEDSHVRLSTGRYDFDEVGNFVDTTMQLMDCETLVPIGCDDDSGPTYTSIIDSCLPGGKEYCVRIRAYSGFSLFDYDLEITGGETCAPTDPPTASGGGGVCADPTGEQFNTVRTCGTEMNICVEPPLLAILESFTAHATNKGVVIEWKTAQEIDVAGFRLLRGTDADEKSLRPVNSSLIPASGNNLQGSEYRFVDGAKLPIGKVYYYLEDVDTSGRTMRHGPVEVNIGGHRQLTRTVAQK